MMHQIFSAKLEDGRQICLSPISADVYESNKAQTVGDDSGYFIYEYDTNKPSKGIELLAKAVSYDAAIRLVDLFLYVQSGREMIQDSTFDAATAL